MGLLGLVIWKDEHRWIAYESATRLGHLRNCRQFRVWGCIFDLAIQVFMAFASIPGAVHGASRRRRRLSSPRRSSRSWKISTTPITSSRAAGGGPLTPLDSLKTVRPTASGSSVPNNRLDTNMAVFSFPSTAPIPTWQSIQTLTRN